ncbi:hypothetical protein D3C85_443480 [compost metagenome]
MNAHVADAMSLVENSNRLRFSAVAPATALANAIAIPNRASVTIFGFNTENSSSCIYKWTMLGFFDWPKVKSWPNSTVRHSIVGC